MHLESDKLGKVNLRLALYTLDTVQTIIHKPLEQMLEVSVERIKLFFETEFACFHFAPSLGLDDEIAKFGLGSCPLSTVEPAFQNKFIQVENKLNELTMSTGKIIYHKEVFENIVEGWDNFREYFMFSQGVSLPLIYQNEVFGVINVYLNNEAPVNLVDMTTIMAFGSCIYGAVKKEVLIRELQDRDDLIEAFAKTIDASDRYTGGHVDRVKAYSIMMGEVIGLPRDDMKQLKIAALLHDVGKVGVPENILNKPGPLDVEDWVKIKQHPSIAKTIFEKIRDGHLKKAMDGILYHHERIDGKGYPFGISGQEIPLFARIIAIADTYDALTSERPYRKGLPKEQAIKILDEVKGKQLDSTLVDIFIQNKLYNLSCYIDCIQMSKD